MLSPNILSSITVLHLLSLYLHILNLSTWTFSVCLPCWVCRKIFYMWREWKHCYMWSLPSLAPIKMAEMLVALWLSCCKPHSPGRVKPTFKPKPRYRQPGQQQWHISTYPKTKCPSFVCNPHSGNLASQHMELSLVDSRGFGVALCSHLTALHCPEELRWNLCQSGSSWD